MLDSIVRAVPDIVYRLDSTGRILYMSEAVRRYGYDPEELVGTSIIELVHPEDRDRANYKVNDRRTGMRSTRLLQVRLLCKDNTAVPFELNADDWPTFLVNAEGVYVGGEKEDGGFLCTQGVARDISVRADDEGEADADERAAVLRAEIERRRKAEEALRLTQFAVDRASEAIFWFGQDGRIMYANDETCNLLGYTREELLSLHVFQVGAELPASEGWPVLWQMICQGPSAKTAETVVRTRDGVLIPVEVAANFLEFDGRQIVYSCLRDISQRQHQERRRDARQRVRDRIIAMTSAADMPAEDYWIKELNEAGVVATGVSLQFPGSRSGEFHLYNMVSGAYSEDIDLAEAPWVAEAWESGKTVQVDRRRLVEASLQNGHIQCIAEVPFSGFSGSMAVSSESCDRFSAEQLRTIDLFVGLVSEGLQCLRDFEAIKANEEQLRQAQKMEAVGELAAGVAHNFNNLLQGIIGNIHLARLEADREGRSLLDAAEESSMRAADMVRQLMLFAHRDFLQQNSHIDLLDIARKAVEVARMTFDRRIEIVEEYADSELLAYGDPGHLQQVLVSLLINARDALAGCEAPVIRVCCERLEKAAGGAVARLVVKDNGSGMDEGTRVRIYDPFFSTKPVGQGTGLGLSTAYGIIQQHGGWIDCRSELGQGSEFVVHLPLVSAARGEVHALKAAAETVLMVADEDVVLKPVHPDELIRQVRQALDD